MKILRWSKHRKEKPKVKKVGELNPADMIDQGNAKMLIISHQSCKSDKFQPKKYAQENFCHMTMNHIYGVIELKSWKSREIKTKRLFLNKFQ